jgi:replicative DNA helicase
MANINLEELYEEKEFFIEEQDLRILKGILCDKDAAKEFVNFHDESIFIGDSRKVAKEIINYIKYYKTPPTKRILLEEAEKNFELKEAIEYLYEEMDKIHFNKDEFKYDLEKLKNKKIKDIVGSLKDKINDIDLDDGVDWESTTVQFRRYIDDVDSIRKERRKVYTQKTLKEYMPEFREDFARKVKDPELSKGVLTGYSYLDYITNGLFPSQMLIIAGATGGGKSVMLNNMALQMWRQKNTIYTPQDELTEGHDILYFSLEMPFELCVRRSMACLSDLSIYSIRDCRISSDKIGQLDKAAKFIRRFPSEFEVVDIPRGVTVEQIEARYLESIAAGRNPEVIVVDYLGLMGTTEFIEDDWLKLDVIAGQLHEFARVYNVIVLTAVQLNRPQAKTKDSADSIGLHRIGRSSHIMHHANIGIQLESRKDEYTFSDLIYHVIKHRDGELGKHVLHKKFQNAILQDMDEPYQPPDDGDFGIVAANDEDLSALLDKIGWNEYKEEL